jgi:hypothetical protein
MARLHDLAELEVPAHTATSSQKNDHSIAGGEDQIGTSLSGSRYLPQPDGGDESDGLQPDTSGTVVKSHRNNRGI